MVIVPRLLAKLVPGVGDLPTGPEVWQDTALILPDVAAKRRWRNIFTGETWGSSDVNGHATLMLCDVFTRFPAILAISELGEDPSQ